MENKKYKIGIFDSGFGGLSVFKEIMRNMPEYDYIYLGDNARAPYGTRSFETVYEYTRQAVERLFNMDCYLVILACNTASAKALRTIQQKDLPEWDKNRRVLGIIRPTVEALGKFTRTNKVGILGTVGTITSNSYQLEITKLYPQIKVYQQACPIWAALVENGECDNQGTDYFVKKYIEQLLAQDKDIDTIVLGCTHYPLLLNSIRRHTPDGIKIINQGQIVAESLIDYLQRHPEIERLCTKQSNRTYYTTDSTKTFDKMGSMFLGEDVYSIKLHW